MASGKNLAWPLLCHHESSQGLVKECLLVVVFDDRLERVAQPVALCVEYPDGHQ